MARMTKLQATQLVANVLNREYGDTLIDGDTDITMAESVVRVLKRVGIIKKLDRDTKTTKQAFEDWTRSKKRVGEFWGEE